MNLAGKPPRLQETSTGRFCCTTVVVVPPPSSAAQVGERQARNAHMQNGQVEPAVPAVQHPAF